MKSIVIILFSALLFSCNDSATSTTNSSDKGMDTVSSVTKTDTISTDASMKTKSMTLKDGKEVKGTLASATEVEDAKSAIEAQGINVGDCCGQEACISGYIWSCSRANDNKCYWYKSDWKCNK